LRQGDPLASLLVLAMEFLTQILKKKILGCKNFKFHPRCENMHLIKFVFADDLMIFTRAKLLLVHLAKRVWKTLK